jgi:thioredoxin reductase (NADPH)
LGQRRAGIVSLGPELETLRRVPLAPGHVDAICAIGGEVEEVEVVDPCTGERLFDHGLGPAQCMGEIGFPNRATNHLTLRAGSVKRVASAVGEGSVVVSRIRQ